MFVCKPRVPCASDKASVDPLLPCSTPQAHLINDRQHRVVQHSFETGQRVFEPASVESCAVCKIVFDLTEQQRGSRESLR